MQSHEWVCLKLQMQIDSDKHMHLGFYLSSVMQACLPWELWVLQQQITKGHTCTDVSKCINSKILNLLMLMSQIRYPSQGDFGLLVEGRNLICCKNSAPTGRKCHQQTDGGDCKQIWQSFWSCTFSFDGRFDFVLWYFGLWVNKNAPLMFIWLKVVTTLNTLAGLLHTFGTAGLPLVFSSDLTFSFFVSASVLLTAISKDERKKWIGPKIRIVFSF